ncbi:MAG: polysaccharide biosynthesis/export family protein [Candidatus Omnitrophica bacterium]|nr:polysaccharide biosynthesis/export family protein [Candidatus Omnitrophota bacterium]
MLGTCLFVCLAVYQAIGESTSIRIRDSSGYNSPLLSGNTEADYYLGVGDKLKILCWRNNDLSGSFVINPDGKISFPLIGSIEAANLTIQQLQDKMKEKLSTYIRYPDVTVTVESVSGRKIIVLGEVVYPGVYTFEGTISVLDAIALAGDVTEDAKRESVIVVSDNFSDHPKARRVNFFKTIREGTFGKDMLLKPGDVIYVPKTFIADVAKFGDYLNRALSGSDKLTTGLFDWRRELRHVYRKNVPGTTSEKAFD